jgi:hypothetical protein
VRTADPTSEPDPAPAASPEPVPEDGPPPAEEIGAVTAVEPTVAEEPAPPEDTPRKLLPELAGTSLRGENVSTVDFRGRPLFVVFFADH